MIHIACPSCNAAMKVAEGKALRKGACPNCGAVFILSTCPGCGRAIPLLPHELSCKVVCSVCDTSFLPTAPSSPSGPDNRTGPTYGAPPEAAEGEADFPPAEAQAPRRGFPLWVLVGIPAAGLLLCCAGVVGTVAYLGARPSGARGLLGTGQAPLSRTEFEKRTLGRWPKQVIEQVGRPDKTVSGETGLRGNEHWFYYGRTIDPASGKRDEVVEIVFWEGIVNRFYYH
jgi:hypothetical protein